MKWDIDKIRNYRMKDKNTYSIREKAMRGLAVFLVFVIIFSLLSRAADSITVAKVSVTYAQSKVIEHTVSLTGKVEQNQEQSISTLKNIVVKKIRVNEGQSVSEGDTLFELDMEDIEEQKQELEYQIEIIDLNLADLVSAQEVEQAISYIKKQRVSEDYNNAVENGDTAITQAYEVMINAYNELLKYSNSTSDNSSKTDQVETALAKAVIQSKEALLAAQADTVQLNEEMNKAIEEAQTNAQIVAANPLTQAQLNAIEDKIEREFASRLAEANEAVTSAQSANTDAVNALSEYQADQVAEASQSAESEEKALLESYNEKVRAYEAAIDARNDSVLDSTRAIEDANAETGSSSDIEKTELEREQLVKDMEKLENIIQREGVITAPVDGVITQINLTVGGVTAETASILMADAASGYKFVAQATYEQQEYLTKNDPVTLSTSDNKIFIENLTIDMMAVNKDDSTIMDITVLIPDASIDIGTTVTLELTKKSDTYNMCVPTQAIHTDGNTDYIFVVKEVDTVLGDELQAERIDVKILEKNEQYAALTAETVTTQSKIVVSSNRSIESGDRIRLEAE